MIEKILVALSVMSDILIILLVVSVFVLIGGIATWIIFKIFKL